MAITGFDPATNFAIANLASGIAAGATSMSLATGKGALFALPSADGAFNGAIYNSTDYASPWSDPSVEIVRCTARSTDTLTITRAQEGTADVSHNTGGKTYSFYATFTKAAYDALVTELIAVRSVSKGGTGVATLTAYAPVFGGTTGTGAVQSGTVGTSGHVLTSNGAGALPTFQAASAGGTVDNSIQSFRLTLTTGVPVMTSAVTAATTVYLTPYCGNTIALYDGTSAWTVLASAEVSLSLSGYTANSNYDIWAYNNSGTLTLESTIWTNDTTRATALAYQNGVLVKSGATTRRYVGTIRTTGTTGQCEFNPLPAIAAGGALANIYVWNYNNRVLTNATSSDSTNSWANFTANWRSANNSTTYRINFLVGVSEDVVDVMYTTYAKKGGICIGGVGIGLDSTSAFTGLVGAFDNTSTTTNDAAQVTGIMRKVVAVGFHYAQALELGNASVGITYYGDNGAATTYQAGLTGNFYY